MGYPSAIRKGAAVATSGFQVLNPNVAVNLIREPLSSELHGSERGSGAGIGGTRGTWPVTVWRERGGVPAVDLDMRNETRQIEPAVVDPVVTLWMGVEHCP